MYQIIAMLWVVRYCYNSLAWCGYVSQGYVFPSCIAQIMKLEIFCLRSGGSLNSEIPTNFACSCWYGVWKTNKSISVRLLAREYACAACCMMHRTSPLSGLVFLLLWLYKPSVTAVVSQVVVTARRTGQILARCEDE